MALYQFSSLSLQHQAREITILEIPGVKVSRKNTSRFKHETQTVSSLDEATRRELKKRRAAEYFWQASRCFIRWWNTVSNAWYYLSNKMILEGEIKDAKMSSFSSDFQTRIKHSFPLYFHHELLMSLRSNISNMRCSVSPDETPRRELKIRRAAEYFWRTSRCFIWWWNTVSNVWHFFSNKFIFEGEIKDAILSSFSSDFQTLIKH